MKGAVFFERDGVLNVTRLERGQPRSPLLVEDFVIKTEAEAPMRSLKEAGYLLFATSHQPGISTGALSRRDLDRMHELLHRRLELDGVLVCPHETSDDCPCRRPKPGLLLEAAFRWHLDLDRSFVVSDKWQDAQAAHVAGCTSVLIRSPWTGNGHHDFVVPDLATAVAKILQVQPIGRVVSSPIGI